MLGESLGARLPVVHVCDIQLLQLQLAATDVTIEVTSRALTSD